MPLDNFFSHRPTDRQVWRAIIAFGRNTATYKFAFAAALLETAKSGKGQIQVSDLAEPFSRQLCQHLARSPKQITTRLDGEKSFLSACRKFNERSLDLEELLAVTEKKGFVNVVEAFLSRRTKLCRLSLTQHER